MLPIELVWYLLALESNTSPLLPEWSIGTATLWGVAGARPYRDLFIIKLDLLLPNRFLYSMASMNSI